MRHRCFRWRLELRKFYWAAAIIAGGSAMTGCSKSVPTTVPESQKSVGTNDQASPGAATELKWTKVDGLTCTYSDIREKLKIIMEEYGISGLAIAVAQDPNSSLSSNSDRYIIDIGFEDSQTKKPIDDKTLFRVDRLGQSILGFLVLKLVDHGIFDMDRPLQDFLPKPLPEYPAYRDLEGDSRYKRLTARRILVHRSGLINSRSARPDGRLVFEKSPGGAFGYSEEGIRLLRFVLEQKFGKSLDELAKSAFFDSLSLKNMGFDSKANFRGHIAAPPSEGSPGNDSVADRSNAFYSNASEFNKFMCTTIFGGGAFSNPYIGIPYHHVQIAIFNKTLLAPPSNLPRGMGWAFGRVIYYIGAIIGIMGERTPTSEYCAFTVVELPGKMTAVTIFMVGNLRGSATGRIIREIVGDISPPLDWLGF
jgi:CubicO group peptidase (beta-lactamase class C family)